MNWQEGRRKGDRNIGRYLADTVDAVPQLGQEELEKLCRDNTQVHLYTHCRKLQRNGRFSTLATAVRIPLHESC